MVHLVYMFSQLPPRNNTSFSRAVATAAAALRALPGETALQYHQRIPVQYIVEAGRRGLYLYHHMGSGKSRTGVAAAEALAAALPNWHVLFVSTKSLHSNFAEEARKFYEAEGVPEAEWAARLAKYKFVSSNASNMLVQLRRTQSTVIDLENTIVIIDEVHEMCNAIANGSANAHGFYTAIMRTRNLKLLCLSGTPITGDPFEFALAMNMVAGRDDHGRALFGESYVAFVEAFIDKPDAIDPDAGIAKKLPPVEDDDKPAKTGDKPAKTGGDKPTESVDKEEARLSDLRSKSEGVPTTEGTSVQGPKGPEQSARPGMRNKDKFVARIIGLVSCYNPRDDIASGARDMFPEQLPQIVQRVPMSNWQYAAYSIARESELEEARRRIFSRAPVNPMARSAGGAQSTYRVATRQISNFAFPAHAVTLERSAGRLHFERHLDKLTPADLTTGLEMYSPKICMMIATLLRYLPESAGVPSATMRAIAAVGRKLQVAEGVELPDDPPTGLGIIYSQFNESCIGIIARVLEACGCEQVRGVAPPRVERVPIAAEVDPDDETIRDSDDSDAPVAGVTGGAAGVIRFGVINGETEIWERDALRAAFRSRDNVAGTLSRDNVAGADGTTTKVGSRGRAMALLMFTVVGATGTNTEGVTHVHKMESHWKPSRDEQVDTRAVRYKSHMMLPPGLRRVQTFLYLSDYPAALRAKWRAAKMEPPEPTTDWQLYLKSSNLARVNAVFLLAINAASIDCTLWSAAMLARHGMSCHMCAPTDELLFLDDFRDDIADTTVRCRAPATSDVKAKLMELDGVKYAAYMDGAELRIVVWDAALAGYVPVARTAAAWDALEAKARKVVKRS